MPTTPAEAALRAANLETLRGFFAAGIAQPEPRIDTVEEALVAPGTGQYAPADPRLAELYGDLPQGLRRPAAYLDGGVYDAEGRVVPGAIHLGGGRRHVPVLLPATARAERLAGTWLWGGMLHGHFGHFVTESIGRLWAWPRLDPAPRGIVWIVPGRVGSRRAAVAEEFPTQSFPGRILGLLDVPGPHRVPALRPLRVERLVVPGQLIANDGGTLIAGHPALHDFVRRLAAGAPPVVPGRRLYVSRAGMAKGGRFVLEEEIEAAFAAAGYEVLRPERLEVGAQIAAYAAAERLVFAEGSALHFFALVARPEQKVAIVSRRFPPKQKFESQLRGFGVQEVHGIDAVRAVLLPTRAAADGTPVPLPRKDADAVLDCAVLEQALVGAGFAEPGTWRGPSPERLAAAAEDACAARTAEEPETPYRVIPR